METGEEGRPSGPGSSRSSPTFLCSVSSRVLDWVRSSPSPFPYSPASREFLNPSFLGTTTAPFVFLSLPLRCKCDKVTSPWFPRRLRLRVRDSRRLRGSLLRSLPLLRCFRQRTSSVNPEGVSRSPQSSIVPNH